MFHSNPRCDFKLKPFLFEKTYLREFSFISNKPRCCCFEFAYVQHNPAYQNLELTEEDFTTMAENSGSFTFQQHTPYTYNLNNPGQKVYRDPFIRDALKKYDAPLYYSLKTKNKTPKPGRMWAALINYMYPVQKKPALREHHFHKNLNQAVDYVFSNFKKVKHLTAEEAIEKMPKNTATGWLALKYTGKSQKKDTMLPEIRKQYWSNYYNISKGRRVFDPITLAMRGHLSQRDKIKTRPVWVVSASTIVSELKYFLPFYDQISNNQFFDERIITGKKSMSKLRRFLQKSKTYQLINTDMSAWDSFRASWFHELIFKKLAEYIDFQSRADYLEYQFIIEQAIRSTVLFPSGNVYTKKAGIVSGTAGTLLINTILNMVASYTVLGMMNLVDFTWKFNKIENENWLGDDFAFYMDLAFTFDLEKFSKLMFKFFDLQVNIDKTIIAREVDERKYIGYCLKSGLLYKPEEDLFSALLYSERFFKNSKDMLAVSFSRFFSYLLIGGINNNKFLEFFYYYLGVYGNRLEKLKYIFVDNYENIFKLIKIVWEINIQKFDVKAFRRMNLEFLKYVLLYDYDVKFIDLIK